MHTPDMNKTVTANFARLRWSLLFLPLLLLLATAVFLYTENALNNTEYPQIQKDAFYSINSELSQFPEVQYNLTQFGDALIMFSFFAFFIVYAPKIWEALIMGSLVSLVFSKVLKGLFAVPRPAAVLDQEHFTIIGKTLSGHNSFPSGHSMTVFTTLTILMYAFMPKQTGMKILWIFFIVLLGYGFAITRVAVGAHYPLDVFVGSIVGYISGLLGIFISRKYRIWEWVGNRKFYPFFIVAFTVCCGVLLTKINKENLLIFYFSFISFIISLSIITYAYFKKQH